MTTSRIRPLLWICLHLKYETSSINAICKLFTKYKSPRQHLHSRTSQRQNNAHWHSMSHTLAFCCHLHPRSMLRVSHLCSVAPAPWPPAPPTARAARADRCRAHHAHCANYTNHSTITTRTSSNIRWTNALALHTASKHPLRHVISPGPRTRHRFTIQISFARPVSFQAHHLPDIKQ
jgi:hypothetical protein